MLMCGSRYSDQRCAEKNLDSKLKGRVSFIPVEAAQRCMKPKKFNFAGLKFPDLSNSFHILQLIEQTHPRLPQSSS